MDGKSTTPGKFSGPIGQELSKEIWKKPPVEFEPVPCEVFDIPEDIKQDLSTDQKLLYDYWKAISTGHLPEDVMSKKAGELFHARWLTLAIRVLMFYTRAEKPSQNLKILVDFIVKFYAPFWFRIKRSKNFTEGPSVIFEMIQVNKTFSKKVQDIVLPVIKRNAFALYSENFLASMFFSDDENIKNRGLYKILRIREADENQDNPGARQEIKTRIMPDINLDAESWDELIDIDKVKVLIQPPCLANLSNEDLVKEISPPNFPLHSQSVERAVKMTSSVSSLSASLQKRNELALSTAVQLVREEKVLLPRKTIDLNRRGQNNFVWTPLLMNKYSALSNLTFFSPFK